MIKLSEIIDQLQRFAPLSLAADWDNVGLLLGDADTSIQRALTCLTVTEEVVAEAVTTDCQLIVSHHPMLFRGTNSITNNNSEGRMLRELIRHDIAVYSPHTAFDNCVGGINDGLCDRLGLQNVRPLRLKPSVRQFKLVVFMPEADLEAVSEALFHCGAGAIGEYRECSFRTAGIGTFHGSDASNPTIGQPGRRETVNEHRLEVLLLEPNLRPAIEAMRIAHSYEEPAFDVYPLEPTLDHGEGRIGTLPEPSTIVELGQLLKTKLNAETMQYVHVDKPIRTVALACGAAGEYLKDAIRQKADCFLTGEMRYHDCLLAESANIGVLLPGHHATERPAVEDLAKLLRKWFPELNVSESHGERDPIKTL